MLTASLFLLALVSLTAAARIPLLKPAVDPDFPVLVGFDCAHDTYYAHPDDEHKFIQCNDGLAMEMPCAPAILFWNQQTLQCDYGEDKEGIQTTGGQDLNLVPMLKPAPSLNCEGRHNTLHPNPQSAFTFIQCDNGVAQVMPCAPANPGTLVWNNEKQQCDYELSDAKPPVVVEPTTGEIEEVTPGLLETDFNCAGRHDTLHTNPKSVFSFIQCVHEVAYVMPCAPNNPGTLVWNEAKQQCDFPTGSESTVVTDPETINPDKVPQKFNCFGRHDALFPNPITVNGFIQCVHGVPWEMPCAPANLPPGTLVWNDAKKECDYPGKSLPMLKPAITSDGDVAPIDSGFNCNGRTGTLHPYPLSQNFFVQCNHGLSYVMPCPSQLVWNQELQQCSGNDS